MSLRHSILAILWDKSASGYDLAKTFSGTFGYFWNATHQQVYRELKTLNKEGWVRHTVVVQENRPAKKVNEITETGKQELITWLKEEVKPHQSNIGLLVKLFTGHLVDTKVMIKELERHQAIFMERFKFYKALEASLKPKTLADKMHFIVIRYGVLDVEAFIKWTDETLDYLRDIQAEQGDETDNKTACSDAEAVRQKLF